VIHAQNEYWFDAAGMLSEGSGFGLRIRPLFPSFCMTVKAILCCSLISGFEMLRNAEACQK
jgi:hypothetical protein